MESFRQSRIRANLIQRARILKEIRNFFDSYGYLEVETPIRTPTPAPEIHIDAVETKDWFLQTSPELYMKRLLAAGYQHIYQISHVFRDRERGRRHLPEFTMLEWYTANHDYRDMMDQCENLILHVSSRLGLGTHLPYQGQLIDIAPPWERLTVRDAFLRFTDISMEEALKRGEFDERMGLDIEPKLGWEYPVFLMDYPASCGALARLKESDPSLAERFELHIGGLELCNAFSELNNPEEQRARFQTDSNARARMKKTVYPPAERFLASLGRMPKAAGNALGIDRLVMLFANAREIDDVVAFTPEEG